MKLPFELLNPAGAAQRDLLAKSPFRRLTPQVPLILQVLALIALALSLSRPATRSGAVTGDHIALVIDTSASMSALDESGKRRIDIAKAAAAAVVDALGPSSDALIVDAGLDARIASPLDRDRRRLKAALELVDASDVEGDLGASTGLATDRLRHLDGSRRIIVFTDGALSRPDALTHVSLPLDVVRVGSPFDNAAIIRVDVRSGTAPDTGTDEVQAFVMVANFGTRPRELYVTMREQNASDVLASRRLMVQPGEQTPVVLSFGPAPGDIGQGLIIDISPHDAMPADDVAFGRVPAGNTIPVVLATANKRESPWVQRVLRSDPKVELLAGDASNLAALGVPPGAFVVVDGACPAALPPGDVVVVNPPNGQCLGATVGAKLETPVVTSWSTSDERFRFITLDGVVIANAHLIGVDSPANELVHVREGTIIADVSSHGRTGTLIGFDVGESNWPFKASFVLFWRNLVELARAHRAHGVDSAGRAGEPIRLAVPFGIEDVDVTGPKETKQRVKARRGLAVIPATSNVGVYHASWQGGTPGSVAFAVNLASQAESDVRERD
ncbi:MAG: VWA domain-containing protein, partial [Polyangiaceae bacterium]|nr:VWA domain-containing protein [Polyangiaceae bacterium]